MTKNAVVYYSPDCQHCKEAMSYLSERNVSVEKRNIQEDKEAAVEAEGMGEGHLPIIVIDGVTISGFNKEKVDQQLNA